MKLGPVVSLAEAKELMTAWKGSTKGQFRQRGCSSKQAVCVARGDDFCPQRRGIGQVRGFAFLDRRHSPKGLTCKIHGCVSS